MKARKNDGELARIRRERGLTQAAVAERIGVGDSLISRYEDGSRLPSFPTFRQLCAVYGVTADAMEAAFAAVQRRRARKNGVAS